jgi:hypothetical protein
VGSLWDIGRALRGVGEAGSISIACRGFDAVRGAGRMKRARRPCVDADDILDARGIEPRGVGASGLLRGNRMVNKTTYE